MEIDEFLFSSHEIINGFLEDRLWVGVPGWFGEYINCYFHCYPLLRRQFPRQVVQQVLGTYHITYQSDTSRVGYLRTACTFRSIRSFGKQVILVPRPLGSIMQVIVPLLLSERNQLHPGGVLHPHSVSHLSVGSGGVAHVVLRSTVFLVR